MKAFTKKSVIACTLVAAITFGGVTAYAAPAPAPTAAAGSVTVDGSNLAEATATYNYAVEYQISQSKSMAKLVYGNLVTANTALKAGIDKKANYETIAKLSAATKTALTTAKASVAVYTSARSALAEQKSLLGTDLPKWLIELNFKTAADATKTLTDLAPDSTVSATAEQVRLWVSKVKEFRPAKAQATTYLNQLTGLRKDNAYPAATTATLNEAVGAQTALTQALNAVTPGAPPLNAASARAKLAINAWKTSNDARATAYTPANKAVTDGNTAYTKYSATVDAAKVATLRSVLTKLSGVLHTAGPADLAALTAPLVQATTAVNTAGAAIDGSKTIVANGNAALTANTKASAASRAALTKAITALSTAITAKGSPEALTSFNTAVNTQITAVKKAQADAYVAEQLAWVSANAWAKSYTWGHQYIYNEDCANFTSHSLVIRGLPQSVLNTSSTSLRNYLVSNGYKETPDSQVARKSVKLGDVIQFDWQPTAGIPNDRDHTGVVTNITTGADGKVTIRYTAHTDPGNDPKVNQTIEASLLDNGHDRNGRVFFISIP